MMNTEKPLDRMTLIELTQYLQNAAPESEQLSINLVARELTERFYIPYGEKSFEEVLESFGYRVIEKEKVKIR